ncbi:uncharacterized protein LOC132902212 [Amyelois transitella]|uniref:uncharacterized protein LOC132902212 n=1 Tax=Amyelois transitella TaxID=680683 RepID=UPI00298F5FB9|nr:uncharacterized protein LOC132902212 [Amyelois transitella]
MFWLLVALSCTIVSAEYSNYFSKPQSAASEAQIRFAIENNYDNTGPGAKQRETAYNTYKHLDDALISYLDDPDTKLPEIEKDKAVVKLLKTNKYYSKVAQSYLPKSEFGLKPLDSVLKKGYWNFKEGLADEKLRSQSIPFLKSPLNLSFYSKGSQPVSPALYSLVYDVNGKSTSLPAGPTGQGDFVRGYYSLKDGGGKTRIIEYSVNHDGGYSASERSDVL